MPYESNAQRRWAHTKSGVKALGAAKVEEFDEASRGMEMPERKHPMTKEMAAKMGRKRVVAAMMGKKR